MINYLILWVENLSKIFIIKPKIMTKKNIMKFIFSILLGNIKLIFPNAAKYVASQSLQVMVKINIYSTLGLALRHAIWEPLT